MCSLSSKITLLIFTLTFKFPLKIKVIFFLDSSNTTFFLEPKIIFESSTLTRLVFKKFFYLTETIIVPVYSFFFIFVNFTTSNFSSKNFSKKNSINLFFFIFLVV